MNIPQLKKKLDDLSTICLRDAAHHFHNLRDITVLIRLETHGMTPTLNLIKSKAIFLILRKRIKHTPTSTITNESPINKEIESWSSYFIACVNRSRSFLFCGNSKPFIETPEQSVMMIHAK